jgi:nicotinate-nucleotide adenylyltransferase
MTNRIVLFGGTFDPVHHGHLIVARALAERQGYDRVTFVPAASPPHKPLPGASAEGRLAMLRLAIEGEKLFDVCSLELERAGPSYTFDTLCRLRREHGTDSQLYWLIGADMLEDLPSWHRVNDVLALAKIVVVLRPPWHERLGGIMEALRNTLSADQMKDIFRAVVATPLIDISSAEVRRRVGGGMSIRYLTPDCVISYIRKHGLYRT